MTTKEKAAGVVETPATAITEKHVADVTLTNGKGEPRIDSRLLAASMGKDHANLFELVKTHRADFEQFGKVPFETGASADSATGQKERFALLNEDQSYLLLTYTRNNERTRQLKIKLVKAFGEARRAAEAGAEYLPTYHSLHDELHALAAGSPNERFVHMNMNRLVNRAVGIGAGERDALPAVPKAMLIVAQDVAAKAMRGSIDHHVGYQRAKAALLALSAVTMLEVVND